MAEDRQSHNEPIHTALNADEWSASGDASRPDAWLAPASTLPLEDGLAVGHRGSETEPDWPAAHWPAPALEGTLGRPQGWPDFDTMTWREFELAMAEAFRHQGFAVTVTPDGADGGVDLILERPGERTLVQCKHWNVYKVGVRPVRELYGVVTAQGASGGIVATTGRFTEEARAFAASTHLQLLGRPEVTRLLEQLPAARNNQRAGGTNSPGVAVTPTTGSPQCPRCGEWMVLRTTRRGPNPGDQFWGCPRFPTCRGMIQLGQQPARPAPASGGPTPEWWGGRLPQGISMQGVTPERARARGERRRDKLIAGVAALVVTLLAFVVLSTVLPQLLLRPIAQVGRTTPTAPSGAGLKPSAKVDPRIVASITLETTPNQVAVDPEGKRLYATNTEDRSITILDTANNSVVSKLTLDRQPGAIAFDATTGTVWVTHYNDAIVTVIDTTGATQATIPVGQGPVGVALDPNVRKAYVTNNLEKTVTVVNTRTRKVTSTEKPGYAPGAAAVDPVKGHLCIVNPAAMNLLHCYDSSLKLLGVVGPSGEAVAIDPVSHNRYATNAQLGVLKAKDGVSGTETTIPLGRKPTGVTVDPTTRLAYVADHDGKAILVVRTP